MTHETLPMHALFDAQYQASRAQMEVPLALRRDRLPDVRGQPGECQTHDPR